MTRTKKNWKFTRDGVERTLSVGGLMRVCGGGGGLWNGEPWEEIVTILGFVRANGSTYKEAVYIDYLNSDGRIGFILLKNYGGREWCSRFKHMDE